MKTIAIKMKNYANEVSIVNNNDIERRVLNIFILSFGILALLYVLFLGNMVFNIVQRRTLEADARSLSNEVGNLEITYLSMSDKVDLPLSYSLGFKAIKPNFATRKSLGYRPAGEALGLGSKSYNLDSIKLGKNEI